MLSGSTDGSPIRLSNNTEPEEVGLALLDSELPGQEVTIETSPFLHNAEPHSESPSHQLSGQAFQDVTIVSPDVHLLASIHVDAESMLIDSFETEEFQSTAGFMVLLNDDTFMACSDENRREEELLRETRSQLEEVQKVNRQLQIDLDASRTQLYEIKLQLSQYQQSWNIEKITLEDKAEDLQALLEQEKKEVLKLMKKNESFLMCAEDFHEIDKIEQKEKELKKVNRLNHQLTQNLKDREEAKAAVENDYAMYLQLFQQVQRDLYDSKAALTVTNKLNQNLTKFINIEEQTAQDEYEELLVSKKRQKQEYEQLLQKKHKELNDNKEILLRLNELVSQLKQTLAAVQDAAKKEKKEYGNSIQKFRKGFKEKEDELVKSSELCSHLNQKIVEIKAEASNDREKYEQSLQQVNQNLKKKKEDLAKSTDSCKQLEHEIKTVKDRAQKDCVKWSSRIEQLQRSLTAAKKTDSEQRLELTQRIKQKYDQQLTIRQLQQELANKNEEYNRDILSLQKKHDEFKEKSLEEKNTLETSISELKKKVFESEERITKLESGSTRQNLLSKQPASIGTPVSTEPESEFLLLHQNDFHTTPSPSSQLPEILTGVADSMDNLAVDESQSVLEGFDTDRVGTSDSFMQSQIVDSEPTKRYDDLTNITCPFPVATYANWDHFFMEPSDLDKDSEKLLKEIICEHMEALASGSDDGVSDYQFYELIRILQNKDCPYPCYWSELEEQLSWSEDLLRYCAFRLKIKGADFLTTGSLQLVDPFSQAFMFVTGHYLLHFKQDIASAKPTKVLNKGQVPVIQNNIFNQSVSKWKAGHTCYFTLTVRPEVFNSCQKEVKVRMLIKLLEVLNPDSFFFSEIVYFNLLVRKATLDNDGNIYYNIETVKDLNRFIYILNGNKIKLPKIIKRSKKWSKECLRELMSHRGIELNCPCELVNYLVEVYKAASDRNAELCKSSIRLLMQNCQHSGKILKKAIKSYSSSRVRYPLPEIQGLNIHVNEASDTDIIMTYIYHFGFSGFKKNQLQPNLLMKLFLKFTYPIEKGSRAYRLYKKLLTVRLYGHTDHSIQFIFSRIPTPKGKIRGAYTLSEKVILNWKLPDVQLQDMKLSLSIPKAVLDSSESESDYSTFSDFSQDGEGSIWSAYSSEQEDSEITGHPHLIDPSVGRSRGSKRSATFENNEPKKIRKS